jgi:hypothetical protein
VLFRRAVPQDLQKRFGKKEIVKGLGAKTACAAQYLAHAMWSVCEEVFRAVRQDPTLTPTAINEMVALYLAECRQAIDADRALLAPAPGNANSQRLSDIRDFTGLGDEIRRRAEDDDFDIAHETVADLASKVGATIAPDTIDEQLAKQALGLALGNEYIRFAHGRANELTGPVGVLMRSKLRFSTHLPGSSSLKPGNMAAACTPNPSHSSATAAAQDASPQAPPAPIATPATSRPPILSEVDAAASVVVPLPQTAPSANPVHQGCGSISPSGLRRKRGSKRSGSVDSVSLIALCRMSVAAIAENVLVS